MKFNTHYLTTGLLFLTILGFGYSSVIQDQKLNDLGKKLQESRDKYQSMDNKYQERWDYTKEKFDKTDEIRTIVLGLNGWFNIAGPDTESLCKKFREYKPDTNQGYIFNMLQQQRLLEPKYLEFKDTPVCDAYARLDRESEKK